VKGGGESGVACWVWLWGWGGRKILRVVLGVGGYLVVGWVWGVNSTIAPGCSVLAHTEFTSNELKQK